MSLTTGQNLARSFGDEDIFDGVTVSIPRGARIALVGPNGAGKSTLLRVLAGLDAPNEGAVSRAKGVRLGFLPQEAELALSGNQSLHDEMLSAFDNLRAQETRLAEMAETLARTPGDADLLASFGQAQARFETAGGYDYTNRIKQVLVGLGFDEGDFARPLPQLSGGQKTRALLARLLLEDPDLLILDEPTNHLDIQAIEWLERWLKNFRGALLIVSHDRYFMDSVVDHVWELIFGRLEEYRGNYSHYLRQREERHANLLNEYQRQQEFVARTQDYIARNMAGQNTRQAQGRQKRLERFLRDEAIARPREQRSIRLDILAQRRSGDKVLTTQGLVIGYQDDGVPLFSVPDITLVRSECAALIGPNGAGKSTFLKTILEHLPPLAGQASLGAAVEIGYFAQAHEGLNSESSVLDEILRAKAMPVSEARHYLAKFLFTGDEVYKPVSALSGGERGRVALAQLALGGANLLLLDEPTNHLDIPSQEILESVLAAYEGTILLVSHDRYLIRDLATQIWALNTSRKADTQTEMVVYEGPYDEYVAWREGRRGEEHGDGKKIDRRERHAEAEDIKQTARPALNPYQRRKRLAQVEESIHRLEIDLVNLSGALESASQSGDVREVTRLGETYTQTQAGLDALMQEWESLLADGQ